MKITLLSLSPHRCFFLLSLLLLFLLVYLLYMDWWWKWAILICLIGAYYYLFRCQRPYLYLQGHVISRIMERCECTTGMYAPTPWLPTGHLQTYMAISVRGRSELTNFEYVREFIKSSNASTISIDWISSGGISTSKPRQGLLVIINHGAGGPLAFGCIGSLLKHADSFGFTSCVVNLPGVSGGVVTSPNIGVGLSFLSELKAAGDVLNEKMGSHYPKIAVAFSLAGVPLIEFMAQPGADKYFLASACVGTPLDVTAFSSSHNSVTAYCVDRIKGMLKEHADYLTNWYPEEMARVIESQTLEEIDTALLAKIWGHNSSKAYYHAHTPMTHIDAVNRPLLLLYAMDDPSISVTDNVDIVRLCKNQNVAVAVTETGGHCAFFHSLVARRWSTRLLLEYASSSLKPMF